MRQLRLLIFFVVFAWCGTAQAQVEISFYSKDMASSFPHAYVRLTGTDDKTGQPVDVNYGFTPVSLGPGILFGPVRGMIESAGALYIARSDRHFTLKLSDEQYRKVIAIVEKWRTAPQPSYRLNGRNCVSFVADIAIALGLDAPIIPKLMKKPKSYLNAVTDLNARVIAHWNDHLLTTTAPARGVQVAAPAH
jgi:hypothetical protein